MDKVVRPRIRRESFAPGIVILCNLKQVKSPQHLHWGCGPIVPKDEQTKEIFDSSVLPVMVDADQSSFVYDAKGTLLSYSGNDVHGP